MFCIGGICQVTMYRNRCGLSLKLNSTAGDEVCIALIDVAVVR